MQLFFSEINDNKVIFSADEKKHLTKVLRKQEGDIISVIDGKGYLYSTKINSLDKNSSLIIVVSSDRGLCGGLNSNIVKAVKKKINELEGKKKSASLVCIGKKGFDLLSGLYEKMFNLEVKHINIGEIDYKSTEEIGKKILK